VRLSDVLRAVGFDKDKAQHVQFYGVFACLCC
jgi:hypothetical protein